MEKRPNILWYCTDQQRFDTIAALGNEDILTPALDRLVHQGFSFTHAYAQSPVCTPSRASFLTGMYPSALGVNGNGIPEYPDHFADRLITNRIAKEGYRSGLIGKLHLASAYAGREQRTDDGYHYFRYSHAPNGPALPGHDYAAWIANRGFDPHEILKPSVSKDEYRRGETVSRFSGLKIPTKESDNTPPDLHQTRWCTEMAIDFISRNKDNPWFMSVNPFDPHPPFDPPWNYYRRYDPATLPGAHFQDSDIAFQTGLADAGVDFQARARHPDTLKAREMQAAYYAMITQIDHEFGWLLDYLENNGQRENTIVIFMSDHGETLGDHGLVTKGVRFYEGTIRVPLIISWPGQIKYNCKTSDLVELIDVVPTLYDLLGFPIPYFTQGRSLLDSLTGTAQTSRKSVRSEAYDCIDYPDGTKATMYRDSRWKLVTYHGKNLQELYDLDSDPWEHRDLSKNPRYRETFKRLIQASFDATVNALPRQEPRIAPY